MINHIDSLFDYFAHLITRNDDRPFNEVWDEYFKDVKINGKDIGKLPFDCLKDEFYHLLVNDLRWFDDD